MFIEFGQFLAKINSIIIDINPSRTILTFILNFYRLITILIKISSVSADFPTINGPIVEQRIKQSIFEAT